MSLPKRNSPAFDQTVDVLIVGSGAAGFTAALAARARGLKPLLVEKAAYFGGSSALSGGGLWIPGAPAQARAGHTADLTGAVEYLRSITDGLVSDERLRAYIDNGRRMMEFLEGTSAVLEFVWKPGYPDYYPENPGGSAEGNVINVPQIDLRRLGEDEKLLLAPHAIAPKGLWIAPNELTLFYQLRQSRAAKGLFLRLVYRMARARLLGERYATVGQALIARLMLAFREKGLDLWLNSPLQSLIVDDDGVVTGGLIRRDGQEVGVRALGGVIVTSGGFDHSSELRSANHEYGGPEFSLGASSNEGEGIRIGQEAGAAVDLMDGAWWYPAVAWGGGSIQFSLNERMMPAQFIVNGAGQRFINEAAPYEEFGHAMIAGERTGLRHIPSWLVTDDWSWRRYVIFGHLPLPKIPFAPVPTGYRFPERWLTSGSAVKADTIEQLAARIDVPPAALKATLERYNRVAATGRDPDFHRGDSKYDSYYADHTLPSPNLAPLHGGPYYAFKLILADLGTKGGLLTDERARVLKPDGSVIPALYASGNASSSVMGQSYAGAGATLGPAMTFAYVAANDIADRLSETTALTAERSR